MTVKLNLQSEIKLVVWMVTYNHEAYIEQAIESVMMQETDFKYQLLIGEDCSTDGTRVICQKLKAKYPAKIELYLHENNRGANSNGVFMYEKCFQSDAKYIAICEGDDYWTDPLKLQKQVDFLEENGDYVLCAHSVKYFYEENNSYGKDVHRSGDYTIKELTNNVPYQPLSVLFRNKINLPFPNWFGEMSMNGDWAFFLFLLQFGKSYKMDEIMGVYRIHSGGIWSGQPDNKNYLLLDSLNILKNKFSAEVNSLLNITFLKYLIIIYTNLIKTNKYLEAREFYEKHKINIPSDYIPVFEVATSVLISQEKKLLQTNRLINDILGSNAYKLGRKSGIILNFIFPFREFKEKLFRKSIK